MCFSFSFLHPSLLLKWDECWTTECGVEDHGWLVGDILSVMGAVLYPSACWGQWRPLDIPDTHLPYNEMHLLILQSKILGHAPACGIHISSRHCSVSCSFFHALLDIFVFTHWHSFKTISIEAFFWVLTDTQASFAVWRIQKVTHFFIVDLKHTKHHLKK